MAKHQKRSEAPKNWPIARKGTTFVISKNSKGVPVLVVLRDMLKVAKTRREVKKAIVKEDVLICNKKIIDEKKSMELFDTLTLVPSKKSYRLSLSEFGKYDISEISEKDAHSKVSKVIGKKSLKDKKVQINLYDGRNYVSDVKCNVNDSVVVDLDKNTITKVLPMKEGSKVLVVGGKHTGSTGKITKMIADQKMAEIESNEKTFNVLIKQLMITE